MKELTLAQKKELYVMERALLKKQARRGDVLAFTQYTYRDYDAAPHNEVMAAAINLWLQKKIRFLMIFAPPQHGKSELVSRRTPPVIHGMYPHDHILTCSYNADLASDMTDDVQKIMDTKEYRDIFPTVRISPLNSSTGYERNAGGHQLIPVQDPVTKLWFVPRGDFQSAGVGGSFVGKPGDWLIVDDPIKSRAEADSPLYRENLWKFYQTGLRSRINVNGQVLIMHQRWHEDDLAGRLLKLARENKDADQWHCLVMSAIKEKDDNAPWDWRQPGEALWPRLFPLKELLAKKAGGLRDFAALYQQKPTAEGGNIIKAENIKYYFSLPPAFDKIIQTWDFASKAKQQNDYSVGQTWGAIKADRYLIHQVRGKWPFPMQIKKVAELTKHDPRARRKYVEDKANGPAVMQTLEKEIPGLQEWTPLGDKVARLNAVAPEFEGGNIYLPHPSIAPWVDELVHELTAFPATANDDQVDTTSMALLILQNSGPVAAPTSGHGSYGQNR